MSQAYKTDEIRSLINRLYSAGAVGNSNCYKGISVADEAHLTALLIQATPSIELPSINDLDVHNGLPLMVARYVASSNTDGAVELSNYIKSLYIDYFKDTIKRLMEERANERELVY